MRVVLVVLLFVLFVRAEVLCPDTTKIGPDAMWVKPAEINFTSLFLRLSLLDPSLKNDQDSIRSLFTILGPEITEDLSKLVTYLDVFQILMKYSSIVAFFVMVVFVLWRVGGMSLESYRQEDVGGHFAKNFKRYLLRIGIITPLFVIPMGGQDWSPVIANAVRYVVYLGDQLAYSIYSNTASAFVKAIEANLNKQVESFIDASLEGFNQKRQKVLDSARFAEEALRSLSLCYSAARTQSTSEDLIENWIRTREYYISVIRNSAQARGVIDQGILNILWSDVRDPADFANRFSGSVVGSVCRDQLVNAGKTIRDLVNASSDYNADAPKLRAAEEFRNEVVSKYCEVLKEGKLMLSSLVQPDQDPLGWAGNIVLFPLFEYASLKVLGETIEEVESQQQAVTESQGTTSEVNSIAGFLLGNIIYASFPPGNNIYKIVFTAANESEKVLNTIFNLFNKIEKVRYLKSVISSKLNRFNVFLGDVFKGGTMVFAVYVTAVIMKFILTIIPLLGVILALSLRFVAYLLEILKFILVLPFYGPILSLSDPGQAIRNIGKNLSYFLLYGALIVVAGLFGYFAHNLVKIVLNVLVYLTANMMETVGVGGLVSYVMAELIVSLFHVLIPILAAIQIFRFVYDFPEAVMEFLEVKASSIRTVDIVRAIEGSFGLPRI